MKDKKNYDDDELINNWTPEELAKEVDKVLHPTGPVITYRPLPEDQEKRLRELRIAAYKNDLRNGKFTHK